jgi:hypothetical protein
LLSLCVFSCALSPSLSREGEARERKRERRESEKGRVREERVCTVGYRQTVREKES